MKRHEIFPSTYYNSQDVRDGRLLLTIDFARMESVAKGPANRKSWFYTSRRRISNFLL